MTPLILFAILAGAPRDEPSLARHTTDGLDKQRPAWSPDGKTLAFARHERGGERIHQYLMEPDDPASLRRLTPDRDDPTFWATFRPTDGATLLLAVISFSGTQGNIDIASVKRDGSDLEVIARDPQPKLSFQDWPAWSPDGQSFAFTSTHEGNQEVYARYLEPGADWRRLTQHPGMDSHPCWTPDGGRLVFATDRWGGLELASMNADGTDVRRLTTSPGLDDYPAVSPDGKRIAFVSNRDGNFEVYVASIDGSDPVNLTNHPGRDTHPTWTPSGRGVTFVSDRDGGTDIYTLTFDALPRP
jgi:TolB protein